MNDGGWAARAGQSVTKDTSPRLGQTRVTGKQRLSVSARNGHPESYHVRGHRTRTIGNACLLGATTGNCLCLNTFSASSGTFFVHVRRQLDGLDEAVFIEVGGAIQPSASTQVNRPWPW